MNRYLDPVEVALDRYLADEDAEYLVDLKAEEIADTYPDLEWDDLRVEARRLMVLEIEDAAVSRSGLDDPV